MKIKISMTRHDWEAIERTLWVIIRNSKDEMIRDLLIKAYDKKKMIYVDADRHPSWSLDPLLARVVATQLEWFLLMADKMDADISSFARSYASNLNRIKNNITQQTIR